jgi:hypothetical protein
MTSQPFLYPPPPAPPPLEDAGLLPYDSKEFGLTYDEYQILLDDYEQAIEEGNRKYGYGGYGYVDGDGNHYPLSDNDIPKRVRIPSGSKLEFKSKARKPSPELIAIARGLIKVHAPADYDREVGQ